MFIKLLISVIYIITQVNLSHCDETVPNSDQVAKPNLKLSPKVYSNLFVRRREEQKMLLNHLKNEEKYEKRYKLIELGLTKIITGLEESKANLEAIEFKPKFEDFPEDPETADALAFLLENICLAGDIILHFPDMSLRILRNFPNWRQILTWCIMFTKQVDHIIDDLTLKMLDLFNQEINEDERSDDYVNPYRELSKKTVTTKPRRTRPKIKRGPRLSSIPARQEL